MRFLLAVLSPDGPESASREAVWRAGWWTVRQLLPGDEYVAIELLVQALLDPASIKRYAEHRDPHAASRVDLDTLTHLLAQQIGEGALVEHSQALHRNDFAARLSLRLLPFTIPPSLPLLPHWILFPLLRLRTRPLGEAPTRSPFAVHDEAQTVALLEFVRELETCEAAPLEPEDKPLRCYALLHLCLAGNAIVSSSAVEDAFNALLPVYLNDAPNAHSQTDSIHSKKSGKHSGCTESTELTTCHDNTEQAAKCRKHDDCIRKMGDLVPKTEILDLLDRCCRCIAEEYYFCPLVLRVLLLFLAPCREWNQRVLLLNFFLDHSFAGLLLEADFQSLQNSEVKKKVEIGDIQSALKLVMEQVQEEGCVWEEKEEMIEMYVRYLEQATTQSNVPKHVVVLNHMYVHLLHYIYAKCARYHFYERELNRLTPYISTEALFE